MAERGVVENTLHCSICLEDFKKPKILPCFHTFCWNCLETFIENNSRENKFECPLCRTSTNVPQTGVEGFQTNFYIETAKCHADNVVMLCDLCGPETQAVHRCTDCEENLCSVCGSVHLRSKASRHHTVIELSSVDSSTSGKLISRVFCMTHPQEEVKMYCKQCDCLLCIVCKMTSHEIHSTTDIASEGKRVAERLKAFFDWGKVDARLHILKESVANTKESEGKIEKSLEKGIETLNEQVKVLHEVVDRLAEEYRKEMKKTHGDRKQEMQVIREKLEREFKSLAAYVGSVKLIMDHGNNVELLRNGKQLQARLEDLCLQKETEEETAFSTRPFVPGTIDEKAVKTMLGTIVPAECNSKKKKSKKTLSKDSLEHLSTITIFGFFPVSGIAPIGNGKAWICSFGSSYVELVDVTGKIVKTVNLGSTGEGITTLANMEVIVSCSSEKTIKRIRSDNKVDTVISNLDMFPQGVTSYITTDGDEELLIACTKANDYNGDKGTVYKCNTKQWKAQPWNMTGFKAPIRVAVVPATRMICVADHGRGEVTIHDRGGKLVAKYTECRPRGVSFYGSDRILVVNDGTDVRVIRADGTLENILVQDCCYSAVVDEDDNLWVGGNRKVHVFKIT